jgi:hypothetical protein
VLQVVIRENVSVLSFANNPSAPNLRRFSEITDSLSCQANPIDTRCYEPEIMLLARLRLP